MIRIVIIEEIKYGRGYRIAKMGIDGNIDVRNRKSNIYN